MNTRSSSSNAGNRATASGGVSAHGDANARMNATSGGGSGTTLRASDFGRKLPHPTDIADDVHEFAIRNTVLLGTLQRLSSANAHYHRLAAVNAARWAAAAPPPASATSSLARCKVEVLPGDWGDVTLAMSQRYGATFASLNMANAYAPGGGYTDGMVAQEENMFRRTDCHFSLDRAELHFEGGRADWMYRPEHSAMLNAEPGYVYLDTDRPRVCIRGAEDRARADLGYPWLPEDEIFPFYELRAAAVDLRGRRRYDHAETQRRVCAQLDTLIHKGVRHAVLSAFGCGAFLNPAHQVAQAYRQALESRAAHFDVIAFGVFHAGYGPNNFATFAKAFADWDDPPAASSSSATQLTIHEQVEHIKRQLGLTGSNIVEVLNQAATQLGVDPAGKPLAQLAAMCVWELDVNHCSPMEVSDQEIVSPKPSSAREVTGAGALAPPNTRSGARGAVVAGVVVATTAAAAVLLARKR